MADSMFRFRPGVSSTLNVGRAGSLDEKVEPVSGSEITRRGRMSLAERFWAKVDKSGDCWLWTGAKTGRGYGAINVLASGKFGHAHRVSWEMANGIAPPAGMSVCHHCDVPACVRPSHLFLGTAKDNAQDMVAKGRQGRNTRPWKCQGCKQPGHDLRNCPSRERAVSK